HDRRQDDDEEEVLVGKAEPRKPVAGEQADDRRQHHARYRDEDAVLGRMPETGAEAVERQIVLDRKARRRPGWDRRLARLRRRLEGRQDRPDDRRDEDRRQEQADAVFGEEAAARVLADAGGGHHVPSGLRRRRSWMRLSTTRITRSTIDNAA